MSRISSNSRRWWLVAALLAASGCGDKRPEKTTHSTPSDASANTGRRSPKAAAVEVVLLWDASVQKLQEEIAKAEAAGDTAAAQSFRQKLKVSQDGLDQAKRKLRIIETAEGDKRPPIAP
jgi:predicted TPR repeat methyltransferase